MPCTNCYRKSDQIGRPTCICPHGPSHALDNVDNVTLNVYKPKPTTPRFSPVARGFEAKAIDWLCPYFGMNGGHLIRAYAANPTALWVARFERSYKIWLLRKSISHESQQIFWDYLKVPVIKTKFNTQLLPEDLVIMLALTAGTTATGAIDNLKYKGNAPWVHVDAGLGPGHFAYQNSGYLLDG